MRTVVIAACLVAGCGREAPLSENTPQDVAVVAGNGVAANAALPDPAPAPAVPAALGAGGAKSRFTSFEGCRVIERNDEEAGYVRQRCGGAGGYQLELIESDLRQTLEVVRPDGKSDKLNLSSLVAGGGFSSVGKTAEWRGPDPAKPRTLTLRYGVNEDPDPQVAPRSYLVVVRLAAPACVVARVSAGPRQSDEARAIADAAQLPACLGR